MATSMSNLAAWQLEPKGTITVRESELTEPGPGEIRIKVFAVPIQPVDSYQYSRQLMPRFKYPGILGSQCAGVVDKLGEGVTKVTLGDRVASSTNNYANGGDTPRATEQRYTIAEEYEVLKIGNEISFADAVSASSQTPGCALFSHTTLGLERPSADPPTKPVSKGKKILIWGGSSAMGGLSICYAKLAGYEVIATCSPANFDFVKVQGADHIFDRNDPAISEDIKKLLPIDFWFDTISLPDTIGHIINIAQVQHQNSGQDIKLLTLLPTSPQFSPGMPEIPSWLKIQMHFFKNKAPENEEHMKWLIGAADQPGFLERGLQGGWIKGVPSKSIGGLDKVEEGLQMIQHKKYSGVKIVIEPWREIEV